MLMIIINIDYKIDIQIYIQLDRYISIEYISEKYKIRTYKNVVQLFSK